MAVVCKIIDNQQLMKAAHLPFRTTCIFLVVLPLTMIDNAFTVFFVESHFNMLTPNCAKNLYSGESGATVSKISRAMGIDVEYTGCKSLQVVGREDHEMPMLGPPSKSGGSFALMGRKRKSRSRKFPVGDDKPIASEDDYSRVKR